MMEGSIPSSSGLSTPTPTPTSSSSPAAASVFKPRRSEDWNKYKATIESLYRDDQLKLRDVKRIMEREHKFVASEKQYKDRLAAWNIRKNIKAKEVNIMIRKQQKRAARGKQTVFRVAGQKVDTKRIARFVRRYGTNSTWDGNEPRPVEPQHDSPEPTTPSDMSYYTPEPDERPTTLSPHPENHPHPFDSLDSVHDSELDDTKSLPVTLSPTTSTNDTPTPAETYTIFCDDPWRSLTMYQDQIQKLTAQLDRETAGFVSADDSRQQ
ncbi:Clr5 domain-containing protein [Aspergillus cavernicola]|uniref:Clr5 domain-containing protein n=1 Tax=Aspergillus cavernicola TaxID=176166 RepID=A0ABR4IVJ2_9EURO